MFLFCLFLTVLSMKTDGAWSVTYLNEKGCTGVQIATRLTPKCVIMQEAQASFHYTCSDSYPKNVTVDVYHSDECEHEGHLLESVHIGESGICEKGGEEENVFQEWYCIDDYGVKYPHLVFGIPLYMNDSHMPTPHNPLVGENFFPIFKCMKIPGQKVYVTVDCDPKTSEGHIKSYLAEKCLIPFHSMDVKVGEVVDMGKFQEEPKEKAYMKYEGCKPT